MIYSTSPQILECADSIIRDYLIHNSYIFIPRINSQPLANWIFAAERRSSMCARKARPEAQDTGVDAKDGRNARPKEKYRVPDVHMPLDHEAADPALRPTIDTGNLASYRIKPIPRQHRTSFDIVAQHQQWRESVCTIALLERIHRRNASSSVIQLQDTDGGYKTANVAKLRDCTGNDEGQRPVDWHHSYPQELPRLGIQVWHAEKVSDDVLVQHLDSNIAVQRGGNQRRHESDDVGGCLPGEGADTLVCGIDGELSLERVYKLNSS